MPEQKPDQLSFNLPVEQKRPKTGEKKNDEAAYDGPVMEWVCHPAKKNLARTVAVSLFIAVLVVMVYYMTYSVWFAVLGFAILIGSLAAFYFPTRYRLTENEITVKSTIQTQKRKWTQYRSCYPDKNGVLLSPFLRPSRLENFRGLYIRFWNNRDEVIAFVKKQIDKVRADEGVDK
ncbi:conserved hypothetical protein [Candidatus Zixiibacteriota bacterium]|nr:conserved hypothetical protein [candidate division Zixibacteria bacterium]